MATFVKITQGKGGGNRGGPSFQQSMQSLLSASGGLRSALEQELVRRVQLQSSWNRKDKTSAGERKVYSQNSHIQC